MLNCVLSAARRAGVPIIYTTRHADTAGVQSTNRRLGREGDDWWEVLGGINEGDAVMLPSDATVHDGDKVAATF